MVQEVMNYPRLRCPACGSESLSICKLRIKCPDCNRSYPVIDGIPDLRPDPSQDTQLDVAAYDIHKENTPERSINIYRHNWEKLLDEFLTFQQNDSESSEGIAALEIACGSGTLTMGLAQDGRLAQISAIDISRGFIKLARSRIPQTQSTVNFFQADANRLPFAPASFDLVVGNSVLHHFLHYEQTLRACHELLPTGGVAIFGEPVIDGHVHVAYIAAIMGEMVSAVPETEISHSERRALANLADKIGFKLALMADPDKLAQKEDKWMFDIRKFRILAEQIGFRHFEFRGLGHFNPEFVSARRFAWRFFLKTGVSAATLERFSFLFDAFDRTYGRLNGTALTTPFGYFVMVK